MTRTPAASYPGQENVEVGVTPRRRSLGLRLRQRAFLLLLVPGLGMYLAFIVYPFIQSFVYSFYNWNGVGPLTDFVGLNNFSYILTSSSFSIFFYRAILHNLYLFGISMVLTTAVGMIVAYLLTTIPERSARVFQVLYFWFRWGLLRWMKSLRSALRYPPRTWPHDGFHAKPRAWLGRSNRLVRWSFGHNAPSQQAPTEPLTRPYVLRDGYIDVPTAPGLGIQLDDDAVAAHLYDGSWETPQVAHPDDGSFADW